MQSEPSTVQNRCLLSDKVPQFMADTCTGYVMNTRSKRRFMWLQKGAKGQL